MGRSCCDESAIKPKMKKSGAHSDPFDCHNPVCSDTADLFKQMTSSKSHRIVPKSTNIHTESISESPGKTSDEDEPLQCPVDKNLLGLSTWNLLHTIAAYYPDEPTERDKAEAIRFIESLAYLYPCSYCAKDFQECVAKSPPMCVPSTFLIISF